MIVATTTLRADEVRYDRTASVATARGNVVIVDHGEGYHTLFAHLGSMRTAMGEEVDAGDVLGYGMRGGRVYIKGDVGYRVGIHMKAYEKLVPILVCGGKARDFFGEYMAGGMLVLLGMNARDAAQPIAGGFLGAGMHGGVMYVRGTVEPWQCGAEVGITEASEEDMAELRPVIEDYAQAMGMDAAEILSVPFTRIAPMSHRPYAKLYASM